MVTLLVSQTNPVGVRILKKLEFQLAFRTRACTGPGKPGKSWKNATGPGKFWKSIKLN